MAAKKLGVALVGLGYLSTYQIAKSFKHSKHCRLTAVVTGTPEKAKLWKKRYVLPDSHIYSYETFDQIVHNPDVDFVYLVLPNSMHAEFTIRAAKAGKHVLCEKPMANSVRECEAMIAACRKAKRKLAIAYRCQLQPHHLEARRLACEEVFGKIKVIEAGFAFTLNAKPQWRLEKELAGGGALMDVGIYALQACRYLTGEEPNSISAIEAKTAPAKFKEVDETINWVMSFPSGVTAYCTTSYNFDGINRFRAYAEKGWFEVDPAYGYGGVRAKRSDRKPMKFKATDQFAVQFDDFARCIVEDRESTVSGEEGLRDMRVIEAIYKSIRTGRTIKL